MYREFTQITESISLLFVNDRYNNDIDVYYIIIIINII